MKVSIVPSSRLLESNWLSLRASKSLQEQRPGQPPDMHPDPFYRILVVDKQRRPKTLFHGSFGTRFVPLDEIWEAQIIWGTDGGTRYWTGFHVLRTREAAMRYLARFKYTKDKIVVPVYVDRLRLRDKAHSKADILLSDYMLLRTEDWISALQQQS